MVDMNATDDFGVPLNITGRHAEDFFSVLGRIVALAAILENRILVFYQYLVGRRQDEHTELAVGQLITKALKELHQLRPQRLNSRSSGYWKRGRSLRRGTPTSTTCGPRRATRVCPAGGFRRRRKPPAQSQRRDARRDAT